MLDWTIVRDTVGRLQGLVGFEVVTLQGRQALSLKEPLGVKPADLLALMCNAEKVSGLETAQGCFRLIRVEPELVCGLHEDMILIVLRRDVWLFQVLLRRCTSPASELARVVSALSSVVYS
jgi:hypothetical protein